MVSTPAEVSPPSPGEAESLDDPRPAPGGREGRHSRPAPAAWAAGALRRPAVLIALLAFLLYLPAALRIAQVQPDAAEYIDIARHLLAGQGYTLAIKAYHFGGTEVVHDGLQQRAPLYTFLVAAVFRLGGGLVALQVVNAALTAGSVGLVCAIGGRLFGARSGVLAGLLGVASPVLLTYMLPPMSEALSIALALLAVWLVVRGLERPTGRTFAASGLALGLAYLTRQPTGILAAPLLVGMLLAKPCRREWQRTLGAFVLGLALVAGPVTVWSLATRGSASYSGQTYLYAVFDETDVKENAFRRPVLTPGQFVAANPEFVAKAVVDQLGQYTRMLFLKDEWLLLLLPAWPLTLLALVRGRYPAAAHLVLLVAAASFLGYAATWSTFKQRYQLLTLLLLLPFAVDGLARLGLVRLAVPRARWLSLLIVVVLGVAAYWSAELRDEYQAAIRGPDPASRRDIIRGVLWTGLSDWIRDDDLPRLLTWLEANSAPDAVLAHPAPWPFTFHTGRPATLLPRRLDAATLRTFLRNYRVAYVVLNDADRRRLGYQDSFEALQAEGVGATSVGSFRVYDTRVLWR
jgi:4-amino-4-deoxy-L-arabinose transferase-like glycosyltransferase